MNQDERREQIYDEWREVLTFWFEHPELSFDEMLKEYKKIK